MSVKMVFDPFPALLDSLYSTSLPLKTVQPMQYTATVRLSPEGAAYLSPLLLLQELNLRTEPLS